MQGQHDWCHGTLIDRLHASTLCHIRSDIAGQQLFTKMPLLLDAAKALVIAVTPLLETA